MERLTIFQAARLRQRNRNARAGGRVQRVVSFCQACRNSPPLAPAGAVAELILRYMAAVK